jgi:hypothetical protein
MKNKLKTLGILIFGLGIISCSKNEAAGPIITETRSVSDYTELEVRGAFEILISDDYSADIEITAPQNKMPFIETYLIGNRLIIDEDDNRIKDSRMTVRLSNQILNEVELLGSGFIEGDTIFAPSLDVEISGSGRIDLPVKTTKLNLEISGSGSIDVFGEAGEVESRITGSGLINSRSVESGNGTARIDGSGNIRIYAADTLFASVIGSGIIQFWGNPSHLDTNIDGSGQITDMQ